MKVKHAMLAITVAGAALSAASVSALDYHGYFRDGVGFNSKGGGQACFALGGTDFKARLGNECEHYFEIGFEQVVYKDSSGIEFKYVVMPALGISTTNPGGTTPPNTNGAVTGGSGYGFGSGNLFVQQNWGGVTMPQLGGATIWAGLRYYRRHDVHSYDWFYWNPAQGNATVGIEDVDIGFGKLAFSVTRIDGSKADIAPAAGSTPTDIGVAAFGTYIMPEIRFYGMPVNTDGTLEFGAELAIAHDQTPPAPATLPPLSVAGLSRQGASPWLTLEHVQDKFLGGSNKLAFQFATGSMTNMNGGAVVGATSDSKQWRVLDQLVFYPTPELSGALVFIYQSKDFDPGLGTSVNIISAEARPAYHVSDYFKIAADVSYQSVSPKTGNASAANLLKITVAPTIVAGRGYFARPEIRFFGTYGSWNNEAGTIANGVFGTDTNGFSFGAQMEAWF